jgi:hypothetical protein
MLVKLRELAFGPPLPTGEIGERGLNKIRALAAFWPDPLSSIACANQEIYLALIIAGSAGLSLALPVGVAIVAVLTLVAISYWPTIHAYPSGGGPQTRRARSLGKLALSAGQA